MPCPFCGGDEAKLRKRRAVLGGGMECRSNPFAEVVCNTCGAAGPIAHAETGDACPPETAAAALLAWNTRP